MVVVTDMPVLLAVDGNSLLHRAFHALAGTGARTASGEPIWAIRGLLLQLVAAAERVGPSAIVVGFDDPEASVRRQRWPHYKAHRGDKLPTLTSQLEQAPEVLRELGVQVLTPPGLEADDVLASACRMGAEHGVRTVLVTSDRDAFALLDDRTSVLRVINGGVDASPLMTPDRLALLLGIRPEQYRDFAALRGDASDNLPGIPGIGPKRAALLLAELGSASAIFDDATSGGAQIRKLLGPAWVERLADPDARLRWKTNCAVMEFHADIDLDMWPGPGRGQLPLPPEAVHRTFIDHRLPATAQVALRCLAGAEPDDRPTTVETLAWDPAAQWRSRRTYPPLRPDPQLTLF